MQKTSDHLLQLARNASQKSYAPYSGFKVGACVLFEDGSVYTGCNVENVSYGLTLCAERNALSSAVADGKQSGLTAVAIYSPNSKLCFPCGACRQWIKEFSDNAKVVLQDEEDGIKEFSIQELLPYSFCMGQLSGSIVPYCHPERSEGSRDSSG